MTWTKLRSSHPHVKIQNYHFTNAPDTPIENIGSAHGATITDGENYLNVLNVSTHHAIIEQLLVEPYLDLSLSPDDLLDFPCNKDELFDNASVLHVLEQNICMLKINMFCILLVPMMS